MKIIQVMRYLFVVGVLVLLGHFSGSVGAQEAQVVPSVEESDPVTEIFMQKNKILGPYRTSFGTIWLASCDDKSQHSGCILVKDCKQAKGGFKCSNDMVEGCPIVLSDSTDNLDPKFLSCHNQIREQIKVWKERRKNANKDGAQDNKKQATCTTSSFYVIETGCDAKKLCIGSETCAETVTPIFCHANKDGKTCPEVKKCKGDPIKYTPAETATPVAEPAASNSESVKPATAAGIK